MTSNPSALGGAHSLQNTLTLPSQGKTKDAHQVRSLKKIEPQIFKGNLTRSVSSDFLTIGRKHYGKVIAPKPSLISDLIDDPEELVDYFEENNNLICKYLDQLWDSVVKNEIQKDLFIKVVSICDETGSPPLCNPFYFKDALPFLSRSIDTNPELIKELLSIPTEYEYPPLCFPKVFEESLPFLKQVASKNSDLLIKLLSVRDRTGKTPLHIPKIFRQAVSFLKELAQNENNFELIKRIFSITDGRGVPVLCGMKKVKDASSLFFSLIESQPLMLKGLLSVALELGCNNFYYADFFSKATPELESFIESDIELIKNFFSKHGKGGSPPICISCIFENAIPILKKLADKDPKTFIELLSIQHPEGWPPLCHPAVFGKAVPLLTWLVDHHPDLLKELLLIPDSDGWPPLYQDQAISKSCSLLAQLAVKREDIVKLLLTGAGESGLFLLCYSDYFEGLIPFFREIASKNPDLLVDLLSVSDKRGVPPLSYERHLESIGDFLFSLVEVDPALLKRILLICGQDGIPLLCDPANFENVFIILEKLFKKDKKIFKEIVCAKGRSVKGILYLPENFRRLLPLFLQLPKEDLEPLLKITDKYGNTPLHYPVIFEDAAPLLKKHQWDLAAWKNQFGWTPSQTNKVVLSQDWMIRPKFATALSEKISDANYKARVLALRKDVKNLWNAIAFGMEEGEVNPTYLIVNSKPHTKEEIWLALDRMLARIEEKTPWRGTPSAENPAELHRFYSEMLIYFETVVKLLIKKNSSIANAGTFTSIVAPELKEHCGTAHMSWTEQIEQVLVDNGKDSKGYSLEQLIEKRIIKTFEGFIERLIRFYYDSDSHIFRQFRYAVGLAPTPDALPPLELTIEDIRRDVLEYFDLFQFLEEIPIEDEEIKAYLYSKTPCHEGPGYLQLKKQLEEKEASVIEGIQKQMLSSLTPDEAKKALEMFRYFRGTSFLSAIKTSPINNKEQLLAAVLKSQEQSLFELLKKPIDLLQMLPANPAAFCEEHIDEFEVKVKALQPKEASIQFKQKMHSAVTHLKKLMESVVKFDQEIQRIVPKKKWVDVLQGYKAYKTGIQGIAQELERNELGITFHQDFSLPSQAVESARCFAYNAKYLSSRTDALLKILADYKVIKDKR